MAGAGVPLLCAGGADGREDACAGSARVLCPVGYRKMAQVADAGEVSVKAASALRQGEVFLMVTAKGLGPLCRAFGERRRRRSEGVLDFGLPNACSTVR